MKKTEIDFDRLAIECFIAVRGKSNRSWVNRKFAVNYNLCFRLETGLKKIYWEDFYKLCSIKRAPIKLALAKFVTHSTAIDAGKDILNSLIGDRSQGELAQTLNISITKVSRLLTGKGRVPFSLILKAIHEKRKTLEKFLSEFCKLEDIETFRSAQEMRINAEKLAIAQPLTPVILQILGYEAYIQSPCHSNHFIADLLNLDETQVEEIIKKMLKGKIIKKHKNHYVKTSSEKSEFEDDQRSNLFWLKNCVDQLKNMQRRDASVLSSYLNFSASSDQFEQVMQEFIKFKRDIIEVVNHPNEKSTNMTKSIFLTLEHVGGVDTFNQFLK